MRRRAAEQPELHRETGEPGEGSFPSRAAASPRYVSTRRLTCSSLRAVERRRPDDAAARRRLATGTALAAGPAPWPDCQTMVPGIQDLSRDPIGGEQVNVARRIPGRIESHPCAVVLAGVWN